MTDAGFRRSCIYALNTYGSRDPAAVATPNKTAIFFESWKKELRGDSGPVSARHSGEQVVHRPAALTRNRTNRRRLLRIQATNGILHPVPDQADWQQIAPCAALIAVQRYQPALAIRIPAQQRGVFYHVRVHLHYLPFNG